MYFLTHNANLHKINLEKLLKQEEILWTLENQENQSVWRSQTRYNQRVKPALIRALQSR
jgi:hypothetical protein